MEILNNNHQDVKYSNISGITTCLFYHVEKQEWIVDSGAAHHIAVNSGVAHHIAVNKNIFFIRYKVAKAGVDKANL